MPTLTTEQVLKRLKAGEIITVRAKNGQCYPAFMWEPGAYRCTIGKTPIAGARVRAMIKRRTIIFVKAGWYTEGQFRLRPRASR